MPGMAVPVCMLVTVVVMRMGVVNMFRVIVGARTHDVARKPLARATHGKAQKMTQNRRILPSISAEFEAARSHATGRGVIRLTNSIGSNDVTGYNLDVVGSNTIARMES
ncbi:MAG: hypothetical protein R3E58_01905 [Phycisphaerae bacterium]